MQRSKNLFLTLKTKKKNPAKSTEPPFGWQQQQQISTCDTTAQPGSYIILAGLSLVGHFLWGPPVYYIPGLGFQSSYQNMAQVA
jgi:hypothetical protein